MNTGDGRSLEFPCECVSARGGYSDPWAPVAQKKLLPNGTKEKIINLVAEEPRTVAQLAKLLHRSQPSIFVHVNEMMASELLRESDEWEKKYPAERYYEPNFLVVPLSARHEFEEMCEDISKNVADLFERCFGNLDETLADTGLANEGYDVSDLTQYLYAKVQRRARRILEERGTLSIPRERQNGLTWLFWAEEPRVNDDEAADTLK